LTTIATRIEAPIADLVIGAALPGSETPAHLGIDLNGIVIYRLLLSL